MSALPAPRLIVDDPVEDRPFESKAGTLAFLRTRLKSARILPLHRITLGEYRAGSEGALASALRGLGNRRPLIVRSSARGEDGKTGSQAGKYESVLGVTGLSALRVAVETVIASYVDANRAHEILIQPMLEKVSASGVAFSADPNTGSPYSVINLTEGADTTSVTGGKSKDHHTILCSRFAESIPDSRVRAVMDLVSEVEMLTGAEQVDIEFAFDAEDNLYLFQARPLVIRNRPLLAAEVHREVLAHIGTQIEAKCRPHPFLRGRRTLFGVMPDWNPAEMIGIRPRPLALSLYRELITDVIWSYQRHNYGYRNLRSFPLLHDFYGLPYIDVRVSFNSFIPSDVPDDVAEKLANYYINALAERPALHDKVEFEIIFSCYTLDLPERMKRLDQAGFNAAEISAISESLRRLTNAVVSNDRGLWKQDSAKLEALDERYDIIRREIGDPVARIYWLIEDAKRYGTLPFAGLARAAFIAVQTLKSLVAVGALTEADYCKFFCSLDTVSGQISRDFASLNREDFLSRYGHLRPGTYDIRSPRYDREPDFYFDWAGVRDSNMEMHSSFALTLPQMNAINRLLDEHGLKNDVVALFNFLKAAIEGREKAKFLFTRNLSDALECLAELGASYGFTREDLSYADIRSLLRLGITCDNPANVLERAIADGQKRYEFTRAITLPSLIIAPSDVWYSTSTAAEPNFVTQLEIRAPVVRDKDREALKGSIVMIPNADPGYDWLFSRGIGALVTAYGGINSHMAIRAGELGIPAVIGAGETLFTTWSQARLLHIDCANRHVEILG